MKPEIEIYKFESPEEQAQLEALAIETKMEEDKAELAENAKNGNRCLLLLILLFLGATACFLLAR